MATDPVAQYLTDRIEASLLGKTKPDKFAKMMDTDENRAAFEEFREPDCRTLFVYPKGTDKIVCTYEIPQEMIKKKGMYFLKGTHVNYTLKPDTMATDLIICELSPTMLENLSMVAQEVFFPLLSNPANRAGWSGPISKEVMLKFSGFLSDVTKIVGQSKGETRLPYPPPEAFDEDNLPEKERVHLLETAVVGWTAQIEAVLSTDPEDKQRAGEHPDPLHELSFWTNKAKDLHFLDAQLASPRMQEVLTILTEVKSPFEKRFERLTQEVKQAVEEASDNKKYVGTMEPYFNKLRDELEFSNLEECFIPMFHTLLLVWKHSAYYAKKDRMVCLVREMSNALIAQAERFVSGEAIFRQIEDENVQEAVNLLKTTTRCLTKFKQAFAIYRHRAATELSDEQRADGAWDTPEEVLFVRLESFLERCADIHEFTKIVLEFTKLEKIFLGGTKGHELTETLREVHTDFNSAVDKFKSVKYDIMDVTQAKFDDDFYRYRCAVKELERRLSGVLTQCFDDGATIHARFKLLDSFEGLLERPIIKDELDKKQNTLVTSYQADLRHVQEHFHALHEDPRIDTNMPPMAGALAWCRALDSRVREPMEQLRKFAVNSDREEAKDVEKVYEAITSQLKEYEDGKVEEWCAEVNAHSQDKLQQPLLRRDKATRRLAVNFDDALVRLLREVKYFLSLGLEVPENALTIYHKAEQYRQQRCNLDLIVNMYNEMVDTLHPVERPLVEKDIANIDETVERGISELNWDSDDVNEFIKVSMETVRLVYKTVQVMKSNMKVIVKTMTEYAKTPLADRKNKPLSPQDFEDNLRKLWKTRHEEIAKHQETVSKLLFETNQALKVNKGSPIWRAYVEYVQGHVKDGLAQTIVNSIKFICEQLDPAIIQKSNLVPLLEIKLGLYANDVLFNAEEGSLAPGLDEKNPRKSRRDVWQIVNDWVEGFFEIGTIMTRMDGSHYVGDLKKNDGIVRFINTLKKHLDWNQKECELYRQEYIKFEFLWKTDRQDAFAEFLEKAQRAKEEAEEEQGKKPAKKDSEEGEDDDDHQEQGPVNLPLEAFEAEICKYKDLQEEIAKKKSPVEIGWLKVNAAPIKQALSTWVTRWIDTYTSYLYNDVTRKLNMLETMMKEVNVGLQQEVPQGDSDKLKQVLGYIHKVRSVEKSTPKMFQPLRDTVGLLKKYGKNLDEYETKLLSEVHVRWDQTVNTVYKVKEKVNNLQNEEVDKIKDKVDEFDKELKTYRKEFREKAPFKYNMTVDEAYDQILKYHLLTNEIEVRALKLVDLEKVFELTVSKHREIKRNRDETKLLKMCWDMASIVRAQFDDWRKTLWDNIDTDSLLSSTKKYDKQIEMLPKDMRGWECYSGLVEEVRNLQTVLPLVNMLHSPFMQDRHWNDLKKSTGKEFTKSPSFCLADLLNLGLHNHVTDVEDIVDLATKENKIGTQLQKISAVWGELFLEFGTHKETDIGVIQSTDEILVALEENSAALQGMVGQGKYVEHFIDEVTVWQKSLGNVETVLYDWLEVQGKWSSLEAIFLGSKDIRVQLPDDSKRFDEIDGQFKELMVQAVKTPNVVEACGYKGRLELLETMKVGLEQCEKSLFQYLETKRIAFPRFYFLSNAALLDILSNGYNPQAVQKHLGDCFDNVSRLTFTEEKTADGHDSKTAIGMHSKDGDEYVDFYEPFVAEGAVEDWLNRLVEMMRQTLRLILSKSKATADHWEIDKPREKWLYDYPAQMALTASQVIWTEEVNAQFEAFGDGNEQAMKDYAKVLAARLECLINLVLGKLSKCDRVKIITLITVDVHNRDVVGMLIDTKTQDASAFAWQSQMRYKWIQEGYGCIVQVADADFNYSYEYVGNTGRLVITPLTDRCYITLTQALRLIMGGAPAGPAGTGKTETTKDLGRGMGLPVYVFNCSEQMNVQSMGAVFKGLCQTGAWGCFDEFNRIPIEVLSVVSTQFSCILNAIREKRDEFDFLGEMIRLVPTIGAFITMNPGYAGRTELPENLKALFRSCAMVVPDMQLICENMLMSEGFLEAQRLSKKFTTLYSLSSELLSKQMHYDWGLRATKAVLRVAGGLKRGEPEVAEDRILMRALRDFNLPKLVDEDKNIFKQLVLDLFPGLGDTKRKFDEVLEQTIRECTVKAGLQEEEMFVLKCVELAELLDIRHSVFVIGAAGTGKSEIWRTLIAAFTQLKRKTVYDIINPKAIRNNELYGWLTKTDWHDGVLSTIMRNMARNNPPYNADQVYKWIVLDGDIDPEWIESLNTVMDDNKVLTLVSNERIPLSAAMRLVFEIANLDNATPATVSRAGIIYINLKDVGYKPFLDSWIEGREDEKEKSSLLALFNKYITPESMYEMRTAFDRIVPLSEVNMIKSMCYLLEGVLEKLAEVKDQPLPPQVDENGEEVEVNSANYIFEANFVFACIWAFGGALQGEAKKQFSGWFLRVNTTIKFPKAPAGKDMTIFDYYCDPATGNYLPWDIPSYDPPEDAYLVTKVYVPTSDTVRLTFLMDRLVRRKRPVMMVGNAGTGKTVLINNYLRNMGENMIYSNINLNYYTDAKALQRILESSIDKRSGRIYGPPGTKRLVYFVDDLNMPYVDVYNTQSPLALIRQHMDYGTWFDTTKLDKKEIQDCQYVCAMNPTAGSFTINPRLQGQFVTFSALMPTKDMLMTIYGQVMRHHLVPFPDKVQEMCDKLVSATIELHGTVASKFLPSSKKFHYQFNLRDMSAVFQGLSMSNPSCYEPADMVDLWAHECTRVFADRLVSPADFEIFMGLLKGKQDKAFKNEYKAPTAQTDDSGNEVFVGDPVFTSFVTPGEGDLKYVKAKSQWHLKRCLTKKLEAYNEANATMDLELFGMAMEHVCRVARIIENPRGNALLVGVGGSGKQSLARLASSICDYDIFQISVTQSYGMNDLKADLQELYRKAGVKNLPVTFLLTDAQVVDDEWLVYINDVLASGFIPDLFNSEDYDGIFSSLRNEAKAKGIPDNREAMNLFFINNVRTNLHVVLCFSPVGNVFRVRCRKFPALINCTSIDWFHPWPRDALVSVSARFLEEVDLGDEDAVRNSISEHMAEVHLSVNSASERYLTLERRYNYTTPKSFLELISFYKLLLSKKRLALKKQIQRLEKGINTLQATQKDVAELKEDLTDTLVRVEEKKESTNILIEKTEIEAAKVEKEQAVATIEAGKAAEVANKATKIKEDCERDLAAALPAMERAQSAVDCLSKASITQLKSYNKPPGNCEYVAKAILIIYEQKGKGDWGAFLKLVKSPDKFIQELKNYDAENIPPGVVAKLKPILAEDFFDAEAMKSASEAAANLTAWIVNISEFNRIFKDVKPKMDARDAAEGDYTEASAKLKVVQDRVAEMEEKLARVKAELDAATKEKQEVEEEAQRCQDRLALAKRLVDGLADENTRWGKAVEEFREQGRTMVGDVLLASAFVSYIGAFNQKFRNDLWKGLWIDDITERQIPVTEGVDPLMVLANDSDFAKWANEGLAPDRISLENGAIITQCSRWPLMIDPQLQGIKWIKSRIKDIKIVQLNQKRWLQTVIMAVQNGYACIIESISEELDATLDPILSRSIIKRGASQMVQVGADEVPYDNNFRLFLQTKLSNPHYKPEIAAQCTLINFIVTEEGLEDQMLALVVNTEKPELEEKRVALVRAINDYMVSLTDLENELLERLSNAPDDILSDVALIEGLEKTKAASIEIEQKVQQAKKQEISINAARNEFRDVAAESSWLYFLLIQLNVVDHMYQYSLDAFTNFFFKAIARTAANDNTAERVRLLRDSIRITIFTWVNRGLFEKHKLIFANQLCFKLMQKGALAEKFDAVKYDFLVRGPKKMGVEKTLDWLPDGAWYSVQKLIELEGFQKLVGDMESSPNRFKEWYQKGRPEATPLPLDWRKLDDNNPFMKLLVVRALRMDRMNTAISDYVEKALPSGKNYTECDAGKSFLDVLGLSLDDSSTVNPIFFILSPGADPVQSVEVIARKKGMYESKFHRVALGQGQDVVAMNRLDMGHKEGMWIVLENIHLMPKWTHDLEKKLDDFAVEGSHEDFRVFLSAEPSDKIPIGLLERSIKLTNEPPQGLKPNLKRAFASFTKDEFEFKDAKVKSILFGLCHFHSIIIERIKFGPQGWNRPYPFNTGDLMNSSTVLTNYLEGGADRIPWKDLRYIFGEILYGGHITDDWDRLLCTTYLDHYLKEELLDEMELYPFNQSTPEETFRSPPVLPYEQYYEYIDQEMLPENPIAFGLHPNAEIAVKTDQANALFQAVMELQPRAAGGGEGDAASPLQKLQEQLRQITEKVKPISYNFDDIVSAIDERGPFQNVFLQECDRMNSLTKEMMRSIAELELGLAGELQMSVRMETLQNSLFLDRVPEAWNKLAYPSMRALASWVEDLVLRAEQLTAWTEDPNTCPVVVRLNYLFNPQSFLTAIMQKTAQKNSLELDKLVIMTDVTRKKTEDIDAPARLDGAYITGLNMEGARWNWNQGVIEECLPREMFCPMPVINARAILADKLEKNGVHRCAVYKTQRRGPTYVFTANLRTKLPASKWVLAGVVLVMEINE